MVDGPSRTLGEGTGARGDRRLSLAVREQADFSQVQFVTAEICGPYLLVPKHLGHRSMEDLLSKVDDADLCTGISNQGHIVLHQQDTRAGLLHHGCNDISKPG